MARTIHHFIWPYQSHFRSWFGATAEHVLSRLSPSLGPDAFVVAVRTTTTPTLQPGCVEPEHHHWLPSAAVYDALSGVEEVVATYPESQMNHSHPVAQQRESDRLRRRALRDIVSGIAAEHCPSDREVFISYPVERPDFLVMVGLTVSRAATAKTPAVEDTTVRVHEHRLPQIPRSLVHSVIEELLDRAAREVILPEAGAGGPKFGTAEGILRTAAATFCDGLIKRPGGELLLTGGHFDLIGDLSLLPYEGQGAAGTVGIFDSSEGLPKCSVSLSEPVPLREAKSLRKLLMLAADGRVLVSDGENVHGLAEPEAVESVSPSVRLRVTERGAWSLHADGRELMVVRDGRPRLPAPPADPDHLSFELRRRVSALNAEVAERLAEVAVSLTKAEHGAVLVVAADAEAEASRLRTGGLPVDSVDLSPENALLFSRIDGATLCDAEGVCHALGVILDGRATDQGDRGRGARFNSTMRYVETHGPGAAAVVVSEDGGLDLLPLLKPAVEAAELERRLEALEAVAASTAEPPDRRREVDAIERLTACSYVLTAEQCDRANLLIGQIDDRFQERNNLRIARWPLKPDPKFDPARDLY